MTGYNPLFGGHDDLQHAGPPRITFSGLEVGHLAIAVVFLSYAFAILLDDSDRAFDLVPDPIAAISAFAAVASGFVLHELAHKIVAQRYGHWAEFRAHFLGLAASVLIAVSTGFLIAAPGAVMIQGRVTPRENGIISLVGPGTNFVIAALCLPFFMFAVNDEAMVPRIFATVTGVNALLALFNLIPLDPFDGRKVWRWSKPTYGLSVVACLGLFIFALTKNALG